MAVEAVTDPLDSAAPEAAPPSVAADAQALAPDPDTPSADAASSPASPEGAPAVDAHLIDPKTLPPDLVPHWQRMQAAHTKRSQKLAEERKALGEAREAATLVQRFWQDPDYARTVIAQRAAQLGLTLPPGTPATPGHPTTSEAPPAEYIEAFAETLGPDLAFMAEKLAVAKWKTDRIALQPLLAREQQREQAALTAERDRSRQTLAEMAPGWDAYEDEMAALDAFLQSGAATSPRFGARDVLLYRLATGHAGAVATAASRMAQAAKARTTTGTPVRQVQPNLTERVLKAPTMRDAFQIAAKDATEKLRAEGALPPE